jgi:hypothetical protein
VTRSAKARDFVDVSVPNLMQLPRRLTCLQ